MKDEDKDPVDFFFDFWEALKRPSFNLLQILFFVLLVVTTERAIIPNWIAGVLIFIFMMVSFYGGRCDQQNR